MNRLSLSRDVEPELAASGSASPGRAALYTLLVLMLAGGGWVRFNDGIAALAPGLAAPAAGAGLGAATKLPVDMLMELPLLSRTAEPAAVAGLGLPASDAAAITSALKRDRLRLVQIPLFDAGSSAPDGTDAGRTVLVSSGGYDRLIRLGRQPVVVTLPIDRVGTVSFQVPAGEAKALPPSGLGIGALTQTGPMRLPDLGANQELEVGVIAQ